MRTIEYLFGPSAPIFWPGVVVALAVAVLCSVLSVPVVLKRMSFIGQGVSHAAFGGVGLVLALGLGGASGSDVTGTLLVGAFCVACALAISGLSERRGLSADTAIGVVLVTAMALGFVLIRVAVRARAPGEAPVPAVEAILFGSVLGVGWTDALLAGVLAAAELGAIWWCRRPLLFWAFDEPAARAFGVPTGGMRTLLTVLLALAIVVTMRLAGVVLATALLVLPGAIALQLSRRLGVVLTLATSCGLAGVLGGMSVSFELDWQPGPCIVLVLAGMFALARAAAVLRRPAA